MEYTKHCEDLLWAVWGLDSVESESEGNEFQSPSTNEKEYQRVLKYWIRDYPKNCVNLQAGVE